MNVLLLAADFAAAVTPPPRPSPPQPAPTPRTTVASPVVTPVPMPVAPDGDLQSIIDAWPTLSEPVKQRILGIVEGATGVRESQYAYSEVPRLIGLSLPSAVGGSSSRA